MAEPKKRLTSTRSGNRRSHHALKALSLIKCPNCGKSARLHQVCRWCGYYKGTRVMEPKA